MARRFGLVGLFGVVLACASLQQAEAVILINEVLANPGGLDANRDGTPHFSQDEFVELVNTEATDVALSGWRLFDSVGLKHLFAAEALIPGRGFFVVFGGGSPAGFSHVATASSGSLALNNSGDTAKLFDPALSLMDFFMFGAAPIGESFTRFPDGTGPFVEHLDVSPLRFSPGTTVDGSLNLPGEEQRPLIPEPSSLILLGGGVLGLIGLRRDHRRWSPKMREKTET